MGKMIDRAIAAVSRALAWRKERKEIRENRDAILINHLVKASRVRDMEDSHLLNSIFYVKYNGGGPTSFGTIMLPIFITEAKIRGLKEPGADFDPIPYEDDHGNLWKHFPGEPRPRIIKQCEVCETVGTTRIDT